MESSTIAERVAVIRAQVADAVAAAGRPAGSVRILAATKTQDPPRIRAAVAAGIEMIGENRVQELTAKAEALADLRCERHFIGQLQTNKIGQVVRLADCVQSVDRLSLAQRLSSHCRERAEAGWPLRVLIEVNVSGEQTKAGCRPQDAIELAAAVGELPGLELQGLMTIGLNSPDRAAVGAGYRMLRELAEQIRAEGAPGTENCRSLSMGMSGDFATAIAEGATIVRIGSALFGQRPAAAKTIG